MCGISGLASISAEISQALQCVDRMTEHESHRGPDGSGCDLINQSNPTLAFGHRRLAIIDLSEGGRQPMVDSETGNTITFNGEIFNFQELRDQLTAAGAQFQSESDTEVILKLYARKGIDGFRDLRGMFALAIWDVQQQRLVIVRDQIGVKPLYYWQDPANGDLLFGSEVRALLASDRIPRQLDHDGLFSYLSYGSVQEPNTLIEQVWSLLPGHIMIWQAGKISIQRYWHALENQQRRPADLAEIKHLLTDAVERQLMSDVPLGAFLSGGIDSTAIVALMKQRSDRVKTFSIIFDETEFDERAYARAAAKHIGVEHHELLLSGAMVKQGLNDAIGAFDMPSMDGLNTYFVSKITREAGITVALSGVGGDELFGGYSGYQKSLQVERWQNSLSFMPRGLSRLAGRLTMNLSRSDKVQRVGEIVSADLHAYFVSRKLFSNHQVQQLSAVDIRPKGAWLNRFQTLIKDAEPLDPINRASYFELQSYMLSTLLRDTDQMSMAHALEVRVPLLDHKLIEHMLQIDGAAKLVDNHPKPLLTKPLNGMLPDECVFRKKQGFEFPFDRWLREALHDEIKSSFLSDPHPLFNRNELQMMWTQFEQGKLRWSRVWTLFVLQRWLITHRVSI
ncbi:MAG: asparagine synthase (glutamine-hydrolyzing) [Candidatus Promineifilaceae bacterium]